MVLFELLPLLHIFFVSQYFLLIIFLFISGKPIIFENVYPSKPDQIKFDSRPRGVVPGGAGGAMAGTPRFWQIS